MRPVCYSHWSLLNYAGSSGCVNNSCQSSEFQIFCSQIHLNSTSTSRHDSQIYQAVNSPCYCATGKQTCISRLIIKKKNLVGWECILQLFLSWYLPFQQLCGNSVRTHICPHKHTEIQPNPCHEWDVPLEYCALPVFMYVTFKKRIVQVTCHGISKQSYQTIICF